MPFDGVVLRNVVGELNYKLINGKIDKITQPERDEIILTLRNNNTNYKLLLSASPNYPRIHLSDAVKQNPVSAPIFCMVLRKHLSGGRILKIEQFNLDRIVKIYIECYDELGSLSNKIIICEIMGRYSNIILLNETTNIIIDSIKHLTPDMSSYRQILPGLIYKNPPQQDKIEPLDFDVNELLSRIKTSSGVKPEKFVLSSINGFSKLSSKEICQNAGLDIEFDIDGSCDSEVSTLVKATIGFIDDVVKCNFSPCIYYNGTELYDFYSFKLNCLNLFECHLKPSISEVIDEFYFKKDLFDRAKQKSSDIFKVVNTNLNRCLKKLSVHNEKLEECKDKDKWKLFGDLIISNLYNIKKGDINLEVINYFDEKNMKVKIPLDKMLTPIENAQRYYKKYNKAKIAQTITQDQKIENLDEIKYLENQLLNLETCSANEEIEEIRTELITLGYLKKNKKQASRKSKPSKPMHFISSDTTDIYVGKNNVQNDYLTTKFANPSDIWMHTKNIPGSHVIIKTDINGASESSIIEAAKLAAYYSKAKNSSNVPVDYTERKNVKKPSGAKPGMVIYYTNKTINVTPDKTFIENIKKAE